MHAMRGTLAVMAAIEGVKPEDMAAWEAQMLRGLEGAEASAPTETASWLDFGDD